VNILITGGTGFLGQKTIHKLLRHPGLKLHLIHRSTSNLDFLSTEDKTQVNLINIDKNQEIKGLINEGSITTILHMATNYDRNGSQISEVVEANLTLPLKLLVAGENTGLKHFINIDSFYTKAEFEYKRLFNYTQSKRALIPWLKNFSDSILVSNMILEHMYGPGDRDDKLIPNLIRNARENWQTDIIQSGGEQIRDFIYVDDVVSALECVIEKESYSRVGYRNFEVGTGTGTTLVALTSVISELLQCTKEPKFKRDVYPPYEIMRSVAQNESLTSLGWGPKYSLVDGLTKTLKVM
jgi:CDP-paratose synthetase